MKTSSNQLIEDLEERTQSVLRQCENLRELSPEVLNRKPSEDAWSALECIEHLRRYSDFYIPEMLRRINNTNSKPSETFRSGMFGNWFAKMMAPSEKPFKMKTFPSKNPSGSQLGMEVLEEFMHQQRQTLELLREAREVSLHKTKVKTTLGLIFKLKLGDALRVVIYHNQRHLQQAERAIKEVQQGS